MSERCIFDRDVPGGIIFTSEGRVADIPPFKYCVLKVPPPAMVGETYPAIKGEANRVKSIACDFPECTKFNCPRIQRHRKNLNTSFNN